MKRSTLLAAMCLAAGVGCSALQAQAAEETALLETADPVSSKTEDKDAGSLSYDEETAAVSIETAADADLETVPLTETVQEASEPDSSPEANLAEDQPEEQTKTPAADDAASSEALETAEEESAAEADPDTAVIPEAVKDNNRVLSSQIEGWNETKTSYIKDGKAAVGLVEIDQQTYFFDNSGLMLKGQKKIGDDYYCFDLETGVMKKGITYLSEDYNSKRNGGAKTVYYDLVTGKMRHGQKLIEGDYYCFDINSGAMKTGFTWLGIEYEPFHPKVVYYNEDGKMMHGQKKIDGEWYCFDINSGERKTGLTWLGIEYEPYHPKAVFYDEKGRMRKGIQQIDGKTYAFDVNSGARLTGLTWLGVEYDKENPRAVYFNERGQLETGEKLINGDWYCFDHKTGARMTGIVTLGKEYGYSTPRTVGYSERGKRLGGLQTLNGKRMLFDPATGIVQTVFNQLGQNYGLDEAIIVYTDKNGVLQTGEQKIDGNWYCFDHQTGAMKTGLTSLDSSYTGKDPVMYYYDEKGCKQFGSLILGTKFYDLDEKTGALHSKPIDFTGKELKLDMNLGRTNNCFDVSSLVNTVLRAFGLPEISLLCTDTGGAMELGTVLDRSPWYRLANSPEDIKPGSFFCSTGVYTVNNRGQEKYSQKIQVNQEYGHVFIITSGEGKPNDTVVHDFYECGFTHESEKVGHDMSGTIWWKDDNQSAWFTRPVHSQNYVIRNNYYAGWVTPTQQFYELMLKLALKNTTLSGSDLSGKHLIGGSPRGSIRFTMM